jgi:peptidoglycan/LPS O-acetylase OafA/YrhL
MSKRKYFLVLIVAIACLGCFFLLREFEKKRIVEKQIVYTSDVASEVYMVWGIDYLQMPSEKFWPQGSYLKDGLVYTKMPKVNDKFIIKLSLPNNTILNYWMVQRKDKKGNKTDIWDAGESDKEYYLVTFSDASLLKPGYFIFLAGFLPLIIIYYNNKKKQISITNNEKFKIREYIPQFDSLRGIAVLLVIFHHWLPEESALHFLKKGALGVNFFFVLSGFLISHILLRSKKQAEEDLTGKAAVFRNFYIRRTLRIFPIYYLVLIVLFFLHDPSIQEHGTYYFTYTANYLFYSQQFFPGRLAHLWSLAVEEQFYLVWPWLIILINKELLPYIIGLFIVVGISSNYIFINNGWWVSVFTPACFDAFAIGAFLSYLVVYRQDIIEQIQPKFKIIFFIVFLLFVLALYEYSFLPIRTAHSLLAVVILYYCLFKNNNKVANYILNNKWLIRVGKISYGIYLYHLFIPELWMGINNKASIFNIDLFYNKAIPDILKPTWLFVQEFSFLMLVSVFSWRFIEKPINNLKNKFEYKRKRLDKSEHPGENIVVEEMVSSSQP